MFLFVGLGVWLTLVGRALWPAIRKGGESKSIIVLLFLSTICIGLFYGAGLMWGEHTSPVDGRVLALVGGAPVGRRLLRSVRDRGDRVPVHAPRPGAREHGDDHAVLFATIVFLAGGVLGTLHHLYFTGTPTAVIALGASFSALEVVPLAFIGFEAYHTFKLRPGDAVDAAVSLADHVLHRGRVLEPGRRRAVRLPDQPAAAAVLHAGPQPHAAARSHRPVRRVRLARHRADAVLPARTAAEHRLERAAPEDQLLGASTSARRDGAADAAADRRCIQLTAAIDHGYWYARSADLMQKPIIQLLVWMRVPGDTIFSVGALALAWFVLRLWIAPRHVRLPTVPGGTSAGRALRWSLCACWPRRRIACCSSSARATCCWR